MPEMRFHVVWPDGSRERCYSPSLIIKEYFTPGQRYAIADFRERSRAALTIASERVAAKYGFACSGALDQLARIESACARFADRDGADVLVDTFEG